MTMNCYSWRGRKGNVRDHTERPQALIWKPILIWIPKFILISFLKKGAMFIKNVLHVKFTRQKHALLKSLLGKEEHILLQNVKMKKFLLQISISFFNKKLYYWIIIWNIIASIQAAEFPEVLTLTNKQLCAFTLLSLSDLKEANYSCND